MEDEDDPDMMASLQATGEDMDLHEDQKDKILTFLVASLQVTGEDMDLHKDKMNADIAEKLKQKIVQHKDDLW